MRLTIEDLTVKLKKEEILHGINMEISDGEFVSLLGPSGCGKTTLLKSVAGLLEIESGEVRMNGESINHVAPEKRGTVIVFQDLRLFPHMTVEKNIAFAMDLKKVPREKQKETVQKLLADVQLSGYEKRKIREMSGGQLQRVALARALAAEPRVLLLDEPFSGLDEKLRLEMGTLVKKLHREKRLTTILVTHDKREALQMSDRIALMSEGHILQYDTPEEIFSRPESRKVADYFGKVNYIRGVVENGYFRCGIGRWKTNRADGPCVAVIRPFHLVCRENEEQGEVSEIVFMGETAELQIQSQEGNLTAAMLSGDIRNMGLTVGSSVGIDVKSEMLTYFPCEEEECDEADCI